MKDYINKIICGDALSILKKMPDNSVDMIMTSPPYFGLRDYGSAPQIWDGDKNCKHNFSIKTKAGDIRFRGVNSEVGNNKNPDIWKGSREGAFCRCGAWKGELGLEPDFNLYIKHLCDIFDEIKRVLKDTGTIWINLGDTYNGSGGAGNQYSESRKRHTSFGKVRGGVGESLPTNIEDYPTKCLCMIPQRFAIEMINRGWILRNTIIWYKPNCMPSSAKDRFTVDFEDICFFSKQKKYYFEQQFEEHLTRESRPDGIVRNRLFDYNSKENKMRGFKNKPIDKSDQHSMFHGKDINYGEQGRNKRCVWEITTQPFPEAHFAVYPEELCITPIKAGCPEFVCKKCRKAREKILEHTGEYEICGGKDSITGRDIQKVSKTSTLLTGKRKIMKEQGYSDCGCNAGFNPGIVLDPFSGAGTTCLVAKKLGRQYIGIEINKSYCKMSERRIHNEAGLL